MTRKPNIPDYSAVTAVRVREIFDYDPQTGFLTRKRKAQGLVAGYARPGVYRFTCIDGYRFLTHRVVWLWIHGEWPDGYIDHINGNPSDNRIDNLRIATVAQNTQNCRKLAPTVMGYVYVPRRKNTPYETRVHVNGKSMYCGRYATPEEAHAAYLKFSAQYHGEFAKHANPSLAQEVS